MRASVRNFACDAKNGHEKIPAVDVFSPTAESYGVFAQKSTLSLGLGQLPL